MSRFLWFTVYKP